MTELEVPSALAGERVDRVVSLLTSCSRSEATRLVESERVLVGGRPVRSPSRRVSAGEVLEINLPEEHPPAPAEPGGPEPALFEQVRVVRADDDLLVLDKPAGLVVHPGAGHRDGTLVSWLVARYPELATTEGIGGPDRPGIVHRLDKDTSGLLAVALSERGYRSLTTQLADRSMGRTYRAVVLGHVVAEEGVVEAPIGRSRRDRTRMAVTRDGRQARTRYLVRARFSDPVESTELEVRLDTGRTHQIRVHLAAIGHPVLGDSRYGGGRARAGLVRPFLHAERLSLQHPATGETLSFESALPPDLAALLERSR